LVKVFSVSIATTTQRAEKEKMANGSFACKGCKKKFDAKSFFNGVSNKFKCSKHGEFCGDCIDKKFFGGSVCRKCGEKVTAYEYKDSYGKWMKV